MILYALLYLCTQSRHYYHSRDESQGDKQRCGLFRASRRVIITRNAVAISTRTEHDHSLTNDHRLARITMRCRGDSYLRHLVQFTCLKSAIEDDCKFTAIFKSIELPFEA